MTPESLSLILLPQTGFYVINDTEQLRQNYERVLQQLYNHKIPSDLKVTLTFAANAAQLAQIQDLINQSQQSQYQIQVIECHGNLEGMFAQTLEQIQSDFVQLVSLDSILHNHYFEWITPELNSKRNFIKTVNVNTGSLLLGDIDYEKLVELRPWVVCKDFCTCILRHTWLMSHNFVNYIADYGFFNDLSLCGALGDLLYNDLLQQTNHKSSLKCTLPLIPTSISSVITVYGAKCSLPVFTLYNQSLALVQVKNIVRFFQLKSKYFHPLSYSIPLVVFASEIKNYPNSELKNLYANSIFRIYQVLNSSIEEDAKKVSFNDEMQMEVVKAFHSAFGDFFAPEIENAFINKDLIALIELTHLRQNLNAEKQYQQSLLTLYDLGTLNQALKQSIMATTRLNSYPIEIGPDPLLQVKYLPWSLAALCKDASTYSPFINQNLVDAEEQSKKQQPTYMMHRETLTKLAIQEQDSNAVNNSKPQFTIPQFTNLPTNAEPIHIISVVNNPDLYDRLFGLNPFVRQKNIQLHPLLNIKFTGQQASGLSELYNNFLNKHDLDGWLIFCHNDFEICEDLNVKFACLDKNSIYGPAGAFLCHNKDKVFLIVCCFTFEHTPSEEFYRTFDIQTCNKLGIYEFSEVDSLDCCCMVIHSSLLKQKHLRFDPNLRFDLVNEDFCINAKIHHNIVTRLINLKSIHHSCAGTTALPLTYYEAATYLRQKYPNIKKAGTCSIIGGAVPEDEQFFSPTHPEFVFSEALEEHRKLKQNK